MCSSEIQANGFSFCRYKIWQYEVIRFGRVITEHEWKNHQPVEYNKHSVRVYTLFTAVGFYFHINCINVRKGPFGKDEFLRLRVGRLWRHKFLQKQVELQIQNQ